MRLLGGHQLDNAAAAIAAALVLQKDGFPSIDERAITEGVVSARMPGRFQVCYPRCLWQPCCMSTAATPTHAHVLTCLSPAPLLCSLHPKGSCTAEAQYFYLCLFSHPLFVWASACHVHTSTW